MPHYEFQTVAVIGTEMMGPGIAALALDDAGSTWKSFADGDRFSTLREGKEGKSLFLEQTAPTQAPEPVVLT